MDRELDGVYFRIQREDKWESVCFSDMTKNEMEDVLKDKSLEYIKSLAIILGEQLKDIGNRFDILKR